MLGCDFRGLDSKQPGSALDAVDKLVVETNELLVENESSVDIKLSPNARVKLSEDGYEPSMGARPLKRVFEEKIKKPLSKKILFEDIKDTTITVDVEGDEYVFSL